MEARLLLLGCPLPICSSLQVKKGGDMYRGTGWWESSHCSRMVPEWLWWIWGSDVKRCHDLRDCCENGDTLESRPHPKVLVVRKSASLGNSQGSELMNDEVGCLEGGEVSHAGAEIFQIVGIIASLPGNLSWVPNVKTKTKTNKNQWRPHFRFRHSPLSGGSWATALPDWPADCREASRGGGLSRTLGRHGWGGKRRLGPRPPRRSLPVASEALWPLHALGLPRVTWA